MWRIRGLFLLIASLFVAGAAPPPAGEKPTYEGKMEDGEEAAKKRAWAVAFNAYRDAMRIARGERRPDREVAAASKCAHTIRTWGAHEPQAEGRKTDLIASYQVIIRRGSPPESDLARNNLGVLYLRDGEVQKAVDTFKPVDVPRNADPYLFYYNFGRALDRNGCPGAAYDKYQEALRHRPDFSRAAEYACQALLRRKTPDRSREAVSLFSQLLSRGPRQVALVGEQLPKFLKGTDKKAGLLLPVLVRYYEAAGVGPDRFESTEQKRLKEVRNKELTGTLAELTKVYLGDQLRDKESAPLFSSRDEVLAAFPSWRPLLADKALARTFSRLLQRAADHYRRTSQSLTGKARVEAAHRALARYSASFLLSPENLQAAVYAAGILSQHHDLLDRDDKLQDTLIDQLFGKKLMAAARAAGDWTTVRDCHVVLGDLFERQGKWGSVTEPKGAIFHWTEALEAEKRIRQPDPRYPESPRLESPRLFVSLAKAYREAKRPDLAIQNYFTAIERFADHGNRQEAASVLKDLSKIPLSKEQKDLESRLRVVIGNLDRVRPRTTITGLRSNSERLMAVAFTSDNRRLATGTNGEVMHWEISTGELRRSNGLSEWEATTMVFSPDGQKFACTDWRGGGGCWAWLEPDPGTAISPPHPGSPPSRSPPMPAPSRRRIPKA